MNRRTFLQAAAALPAAFALPTVELKDTGPGLFRNGVRQDPARYFRDGTLHLPGDGAQYELRNWHFIGKVCA